MELHQWTSAAVLAIIFVVTFGVAYFYLNRNLTTYTKSKETPNQVSTQCGVSVRLIHTTQECIDNIRDLLSMNPKVLGFDCEWKPYFDSDETRNPVSLLQLSNQHICLLIRLKDIFESKTGIPTELIHLMINPKLRLFNSIFVNT